MSDFEWTIHSPAAEIAGDLAGVVCSVDWQLEHLPSGNIVGGRAVLSAPSPDDFTPFAQLTAEQVQGWVERSTDVEAATALPLRRNFPPPWSQA